MATTEISAQLSMEELECHFTWRPDEDSTKTNLDDVIEKTERKISREPHLKVAYLCTLAYLYTVTQVKDFDKASDYLDEALQIDEEIRRNKSEEQQISSEFVIRADLLHLKRRMKGSKKLNQQEITADLGRLETLWSDASNRARAYGVKGATFNCFGPMKYQTGADAFAEASKLQPGNYHWLYGEAQLRGRCDRQKNKQPADGHLQQLWTRAREIGDPKLLTDATFYAHYAEAILHNPELAPLCQQMAEKSVALLQKMAKEEKDNSHIVYIICLKVYRHLQWRHRIDNESKRRALMRDAEDVARCSRDPGFYLELSNEAEAARNREEAIRLLEKGKELAGEPGHLWIELRLVELQCGAWTSERAIAVLDSLRDTFSMYNRNVAVIEFHKGLYLMQQGRVKEAIESCVSAVEADASLFQVADFKKRAFLTQLKRMAPGNEECLAWSVDNIACLNVEQNLDLEALYRTALRQNGKNDFALEHLGRFYVKRERFVDAMDCFQKLSADHDSKRKLLAESLLRNPGSDLHMLELCLGCGCKDAAKGILNILEQRKSNDNIAQRVRNEVLSTSDAIQQPALFFDRAVHELCARIEIALQATESCFFIDQQLADQPDQFVQGVKSRIADLLELNVLMSRESRHQVSAADGPDRGNLMRSSRLEMTKRQLQSSETHQRELNNLIVSVLKESKEILDRSFVLRTAGTGRDFSYVHAFNQMKGQLGGDFKKEFNQISSESDRKKFEMDSLISLIKGKDEFKSLEKVTECLRNGTGRIDKNFHQHERTKDLFAFMASREHRILSREDCWIIRWIYLVNNEKHENEIQVNELNDQLRSDWSGDGESRTAYDVAHLAAAFAEETWAVFSDGVGDSPVREAGAVASGDRED